MAFLEFRGGGGIIDIAANCDISQFDIEANGGIIKIGNGTYINTGSKIVSLESVVIGEHCAIGPNLMIYDHDHVYHKEGSNDWALSKTVPISIGNNVWIGCGVIILRGTSIGDNCVIGAGAIVKGNVPSGSIVVSPDMRIMPIKE